MLGALELLRDQLLDELVREGREVPPALRKPH
jgi:hypothetical protein